MFQIFYFISIFSLGLFVIHETFFFYHEIYCTFIYDTDFLQLWYKSCHEILNMQTSHVRLGKLGKSSINWKSIILEV